MKNVEQFTRINGLLQELLEKINLKPVVITLKQLEHDNGWGEVVNDFQILACLELEQGIL